MWNNLFVILKSTKQFLQINTGSPDLVAQIDASLNTRLAAVIQDSLSECIILMQ